MNKFDRNYFFKFLLNSPVSVGNSIKNMYLIRSWDGIPITPEWMAESLERYSKIKPGGNRDIWAMQEGARVIRLQQEMIEALLQLLVSIKEIS